MYSSGSVKYTHGLEAIGLISIESEPKEKRWKNIRKVNPLESHLWHSGIATALTSTFKPDMRDTSFDMLLERVVCIYYSLPHSWKYKSEQTIRISNPGTHGLFLSRRVRAVLKVPRRTLNTIKKRKWTVVENESVCTQCWVFQTHRWYVRKSCNMDAPHKRWFAFFASIHVTEVTYEQELLDICAS